MAHLNVNTPDLHAVADSYTDLAAKIREIPPQAVAEVQRIIDTHGPMGYPVALGVAANLARREAGLAAAATDFTTYATRFTEHAATFTQEDSAAAGRYTALDFQEGQAPFLDTDDEETEPLPPTVTCWIGTAGGDTSVCGPDTTEYLYVEDGSWYLKQADQSQYTVELPPNFGDQQRLLPAPPADPADPFAGLPSGTNYVMWPRPDGSIGAVYRNDDGTLMPEFEFKPGVITSWGQPFVPI